MDRNYIFSSFIGLFFQSLLGRHRLVYTKINRVKRTREFCIMWRIQEKKLKTNVCGRNPDLNPIGQGRVGGGVN